MNQQRKNKSIRHNSSGITLIALVVTIIVLIILAGVSINLVLGDNGIITKAQEASRAQEIASLVSALQMDIASKEIEKLQVGEKITQSEVEGIIKARCGETSVIKNEDGTIRSVKQEGKEYEIPFTDIYSGTLEKLETLSSSLKVGDYVKYDTGVTTVGENGVITCRVLYNDATNGLQIISDEILTIVTLGARGSTWETGKAAYNSAIEDLNNEAEKYLNTTYALDARCVGSLPIVDEDGKFNQKDNGTETTVSIPSDWTLPNGWTTRDTGCYGSDSNYNADVTAMRAANILTISERYWLASRCVTDDICFYINYVYSVSDECSESLYVYGDKIYDYYLCIFNEDSMYWGDWGNLGLRPVFSLKTDITLIDGDGTSEDTAFVM